MGLVRAYIAGDEYQAHFVCGLLAREGIEATVMGASLQQAAGLVPFANASPEVWVRQEDEAAAAAVIRRMESEGGRVAARLGGRWRCPRCGEMLEAQFTHCWSCGASREDGQESADEVGCGPAGPLDIDVPCQHCRYNLRGLPAAHRCPECGRAMVPSLLRAIDLAGPDELALVEREVHRVLETALRNLDYPVEAARFLLDAWPRAMDEVRGADAGNGGERAIAMCRAVAKEAAGHAGSADEALAMLREWGLADCRDLGASLMTLVEHGLVEAPDGVVLDDFPAVRLEELFGRPGQSVVGA